MVHRPHLRGAVASALVYVTATAVMGRHALAAFDTRIIGDRADPVLNAAILAWNAQHIPGTEAWFHFPNFYPSTETLTFSEHLLGVSVLASPVYWLTGSAVAAYNAALLLAYPLCGLAMWALVWRLTRSGWAAFVAGLAFAFAPYRALHVAHIQALTAFWAPLALLALHAFVDTGPGWQERRRRWGWLALFAVCWMVQGAANNYYLAYFTVLVGLWVAWFVVSRGRWRDLSAIVVIGGVAALPLVAVLWRYLDAHRRYGLSRPLEEVAFYSADLSSLACAAPRSTLWGWLQAGTCGPESRLFPGATLVLVLLGALAVWLVRRLRSGLTTPRPGVAAFYAAAAVIMWMLAWGPVPAFGGEQLLPQGPFAWLTMLPGVGGLRVPSRFWMMAVLCLSVLMGLAIARLTSGPSRSMRVVAAMSALGVLADGWATLPAVALLDATPDRNALRGGVALVLPAGANRDYDTWAEYEAVVGGWRTVNGYSGFEPPHYFALRDASARAHPVLLRPFQSRADLHVIVNEGEAALIELVERQSGVTRVAHASGFRQYHVPRAGALPPPAPAGTRVPIQAVTASCLDERSAFAIDGDPRTRWHCEAQRVGQQLTADVGRVEMVGAVVPALGPFPSDYPRRLLVETSVDGRLWQEAWNGDVFAETFAAALYDPAALRLVVPFTPREARYVRLRSLADDPTWYWSIAELELWSGTR